MKHCGSKFVSTLDLKAKKPNERNFREQRLNIKAELQIRKKALMDENFPSQEIIDEFFQPPIGMADLDLNWNQPNVVKFVVRIRQLC